MSIFKIITTLILTFVCLIVFGIVLIYVTVNPHILATIGLIIGCTVKIFKRK